MGRLPWSNRLTVEECRSLSIGDLVTSGLFRYESPQTRSFSSRGLDVAVTCLAPAVHAIEWIWNGRVHEKAPSVGNRIRLSYKIGGRTIDEEIGILSVPSPLRNRHPGSKRFYFKCPGLNGSCGRRVGKLYLPPGEDRFACRVCHNLTYRSCKEHSKREDEFRRMPPEALTRALESADWNTRFLALRAARRLLRKT